MIQIIPKFEVLSRNQSSDHVRSVIQIISKFEVLSRNRSSSQRFRSDFLLKTQHGRTCMEKGAKVSTNKEAKLPCCSSLYCVPHISKEMGFLKGGAHKRYLRQCSIASEEQKRAGSGMRLGWQAFSTNLATMSYLSSNPSIWKWLSSWQGKLAWIGLSILTLTSYFIQQMLMSTL
ncbi:uncharacterized protein LOC114306810 [Camellia sinensis]|uniref:uncharacterized protein LOC114306810 n=1 Tax=Camellia sinensis TaxID=4442 RepID=UPI001035DD64|nr:uncharacterized protein LOC114306810 [Camellia sinensis]